MISAMALVALALGIVFAWIGLEKKTEASKSKRLVKNILGWIFWGCIIIWFLGSWVYLGHFLSDVYSVNFSLPEPMWDLSHMKKRVLLQVGTWLLGILVIEGFYFLLAKKMKYKQFFTGCMIIVTCVLALHSFGYTRHSYEMYKSMYNRVNKFINEMAETYIGIEEGSQVSANIYIYYYNFYYNDDVTYEELIKQYEEFSAGKDRDAYNDLILFTGSLRGEYDESDTRYRADHFHSKCQDFIAENYQENTELTDEQIFQVCSIVMEDFKDGN